MVWLAGWVVIDGGTFVIKMLRASVTVAGSASSTCTVKFEVPAVVGVPEITPVVAFRLNPAGRLPVTMDHV
jgi:hypothetical protein